MNETGGIGCDKATRDTLDAMRDEIDVLRHKLVAQKVIRERLSCEGALLRQRADTNADFIRQYQAEVTKYREALDSIVHMAVIGPHDEWVDIAEMIGLVRMRAEKGLALVSEEHEPLNK